MAARSSTSAPSSCSQPRSSVPPPKFLASSRPSRPGAGSPHGILRFRGDPELGAEAGVASCARLVTHLRDALPRVLVVSLAPAADAAKYAADLGRRTLTMDVTVRARFE